VRCSCFHFVWFIRLPLLHALSLLVICFVFRIGIGFVSVCTRRFHGLHPSGVFCFMVSEGRSYLYSCVSVCAGLLFRIYKNSARDMLLFNLLRTGRSANHSIKFSETYDIFMI
jgi:hypothetical protein